MADPNALPVSNPDLLNQIVLLNATLKQLAEGGSHAVTGGIAAYLIEYAKNKPTISKFWVQLSDRAKTIWTVLVAAASGAGIVVTFVHPGDGHWILDIDHLTFATAGIFAWGAIQNLFWQKTMHLTVLKPRAVTGPSPQPQQHAPEPVQVVVAGNP